MKFSPQSYSSARAGALKEGFKEQSPASDTDEPVSPTQANVSQSAAQLEVRLGTRHQTGALFLFWRKDD